MGDTRILLLDEQTLFRQAFVKAMHAGNAIHVIGEAAALEQACDFLAIGSADVIVVSATLTDKNAYYAVRQLRSRFARQQIAVLDTYAVEIHLQQALKAGAIGYFTRCDDFHTVEAGLLTVARGERVSTHDFTNSIYDVADSTESPGMVSDSQLKLLTARELEVLRHLAEGLSVRQSAEKLSLAQSTVDNHKSRLMRKLNVHKSADLTRLAIREGLVPA